MNVRQFEIWLVDLNPKMGSEQSGLRPCLVVETNAVQNKGNTTVVIPLTTKITPLFSFDVVLHPNEENKLSEVSKLKTRQIRVIDKMRLVKKLGELGGDDLRHKVLNALKVVFDFEQMFSD